MECLPILRTRQAPPLDGTLSGPAWEQAGRSAPFVDLVTGAAAPLETRVAGLFDDEALYFGFWVDDPYPRASLTERDSLIFQENDVEIFIDGHDCYYEFELNALNTVYEVFFIWKDAFRRGSRFDLPEFDPFHPRALTFAGNYDRDERTFWRGTHPRGARMAFLDWDFPGLRTAVSIDGVLNDDSKPSKGWTAEIAFPWSGMKTLAGKRTLPPRHGDQWKMMFARFQKFRAGAQEAQAGWSLTAHGAYDSHLPEKFASVVFRDD